MFQVANLMQCGTLEVFFRPPPPSLQGIRSMTFIMTGTPSCSLAGFPIVLFVVGRWGCPRGTTGCTPPISIVFYVEYRGTGELVQNVCGWMPFLSLTSRNHSLDLIFSLTCNTPKQRKGRHSLYVGSPKVA